MDYTSLLEFDAKVTGKKNDIKKVSVTSEKKGVSNREAMPKSSQSKPKEPKVEPVKEPLDPDVPDRKFGDLYCQVCDSHMNSEQMWENHISGKRHIKNSSKGDTVEQKYEYSSEDPLVKKELDQEVRSIAGLEHVCEIQRIGQPPIYQCFLCSASLTTSKLFMEHIVGLKHRTAFLKEHDKPRYEIVESQSNLSKGYLEPILEDLMARYEQRHGRGKMSVKKEKEKTGAFSYKRSYDEKEQKSKASKNVSTFSSTKPSSSRYSPPSSSRYNSSRLSYSPPPKSARNISPPPKSGRYNSYPQKSARDISPPPSKSARNKESEWRKVSPVRERSRERAYSERSYRDEDTWMRIDTEATPYERSRAYEATYGSRYMDNYSNHAGPSETFSDLRTVLEQRKSIATAAAAARSSINDHKSVTIPYKIDKVNENLLQLINAMTPEVFFQVNMLKLETMNHEEEEIDMKLLDCVVERYLDLKKKCAQTNLTAMLEATLAQNGIITQGDNPNQLGMNNIESLLKHYKNNMNKATESYTSNTNLTVTDMSLSHQELASSTSFRRTPERPLRSDWRENEPSTSFVSFSSTPTCIPGLTLTENPIEPPSSSAMNQLTKIANSYFGNISLPSSASSTTTTSNLYTKEEINPLNFRN